MRVESGTTGANKEQRHWYALYTRPRFEKKVDKELRDLQIETFLPLKTVTKFWSDRKKRVEEPVFPSYVFVHANAKERHDAFQPQGVVRIVSFNGQPARIPQHQIEAVRRILAAGFDPVVTHSFSPGDPVEIIAGPLIGLRGYVRTYRGNNHFTVLVDGIRLALLVHIDAAYLKPCNDL